MLYTVYKTTNLANSKYYFGVHKTEDPSDDYLGSGKYIKAAIAKYGELGFRKDVLFIYLDPESAFAKEDELIQCYRGLDPLCMNLRKGGSGGFDWINKNGLGSKEGRKRGMKTLQAKIKGDDELNRRVTAARQRNISLVSTSERVMAAKIRAEQWRGGKHSLESCQKMRTAALARGKTHRKSFLRIEGPEGTAWCRKHKLFLPVSSFYKTSTRWNGLQAWCIECVRNYKQSR